MQILLRALLGLLALLGAALMTSPSAQAYTSPDIWVGSPVDGTWGCCSSWDTTAGGGHHKLAKASPTNDWASDLTAAAGSPAAPVRCPVELRSGQRGDDEDHPRR